MFDAKIARDKPLSIAILAMGGQGGGVLSDWIVAAAEANGWHAQSTSVPGVAQRTGATIYYIEMLPPKDGHAPVLALMPTPGDVDVVIAAELMEAGRAELRNAYPRAVTDIGNTVAQQALADVFVVTDRQWRGIGMIPQSGWTLSPRYAEFDAELKFGVGHLEVQESAECRAGEVLQGLLKPNECPAFGTTCTPRNPLGATMVSSEGACAAYYQFRRLETSANA
jgi:hydrogenase expression/formation protein HypD